MYWRRTARNWAVRLVTSIDKWMASVYFWPTDTVDPELSTDIFEISGEHEATQIFPLSILFIWPT